MDSNRSKRINEQVKKSYDGYTDDLCSEPDKLKDTAEDISCKMDYNFLKYIIELLEKKNSEIRDIDLEKTRINELYTELDKRFVELVDRFNNLNNTYGTVVAENVKIKGSRTYRFALLLWKIAYKLHLIGIIRTLLAARHIGLKQALKQEKFNKLQKHGENSFVYTSKSNSNNLVNTGNYEKNGTDGKEVINDINTITEFYNETLRLPWSETATKISSEILQRNYKGIVVYPNAVHWEPVQRPHHLLRILAKSGFLCFFCEDSSMGSGYEEKYPNVFVVYGEENILPVLQNKCPIVMVTWYRQAIFADMLPQKIVWFDILDKLEFLDEGNINIVKKIYDKLIYGAEIISYSADNLKVYLNSRPDAIKIHNGVMLDDFDSKKDFCQISAMEAIKAKGKKIVGYYGAIEEWFDKDAIRTLLEKTDFEIVLIGRVGIDLKDLTNERLHIFGAIPYEELSSYAKYFDLALIPFVKNDMTDSVSPVKFYEYVAQGLPVLSSDIKEMRKYEGSQVCIYRNLNEFVEFAKKLCYQKPDIHNLKKIAENNTWDERVKCILDKLFATHKGLYSLANFNTDDVVAVEAVTFFKYDGTTYYSGGAERYLLDLQEVCSELGIPYRIYQFGEYGWVRYYNDVEVVGIPSIENNVNIYDTALVEEMNRRFVTETSQSSKLNIYSPFFILTGKSYIPSLGISHGVSWDSEFNNFTDGGQFWHVNKNIIDAASYCDRMISVDTNTCNWFQTISYNTGRKIRYVPNYVDNNEFSPAADYLEDKERVVITYPRRLYGARGLYVALDVIDDILEKYPNVEFHFVGKGFEQDTKHVEKKIAKWGERVKWYSKSPNKMYEVYKITDISLIPTMYSEGTSLSCLEALSSGNVVIATRVGGLTDLVLNDYNGKLVEPNGDSIKEALFDLLDHPEKMKLLKKNAVETAKAFSKDKWKRQWKKIISEYVNKECEFKKPMRCMIKLNSALDLEKKETICIIREHLESGWYVYIACKNNPMKYYSYKRLQYIDIDEDLYFKPEKTIVL